MGADHETSITYLRRVVQIRGIDSMTRRKAPAEGNLLLGAPMAVGERRLGAHIRISFSLLLLASSMALLLNAGQGSLSFISLHVRAHGSTATLPAGSLPLLKSAMVDSSSPLSYS